MRKIELQLTQSIERKDEKNLRNSLCRLRGIEDISFKNLDGIVTVEFSLPLTEKKIVECVENGGHTIDYSRY